MFRSQVRACSSEKGDKGGQRGKGRITNREINSKSPNKSMVQGLSKLENFGLALGWVSKQ